MEDKLLKKYFSPSQRVVLSYFRSVYYIKIHVACEVWIGKLLMSRIFLSIRWNPDAAVSPVRYAKFLSIQYFIVIDIFRNRYRYFPKSPYQYRHFSNFLIDIFIDILKETLSIFCRYQYFHKRCQYFIDISKNADILTINIDILSKNLKKSQICWKKWFF